MVVFLWIFVVSFVFVSGLGIFVFTLVVVFVFVLSPLRSCLFVVYWYRFCLQVTRSQVFGWWRLLHPNFKIKLNSILNSFIVFRFLEALCFIISDIKQRKMKIDDPFFIHLSYSSFSHKEST